MLEKVESLYNILRSAATGRERYDKEYKILRLEFIRNPIIKEKLPKFVLTCRDLSQWWDYIKNKFSTYDERRKYIKDEFEELFIFVEHNQTTPSSASMETKIKEVNSSSISSAWQMAYKRCATDPEGAITSSRTLLESVCKYILEELEVEYLEKDDLPKLYRYVAENLNLSPSQHTEQIFKQILGGCKSVIEGLGALRNKHGDAHGKGKTDYKPSIRHSELSVNLAGTMASFLISTYNEKKI